MDTTQLLHIKEQLLITIRNNQWHRNATNTTRLQEYNGLPGSTTPETTAQSTNSAVNSWTSTANHNRLEGSRRPVYVCNADGQSSNACLCLPVMREGELTEWSPQSTRGTFTLPMKTLLIFHYTASLFYTIGHLHRHSSTATWKWFDSTESRDGETLRSIDFIVDGLLHNNTALISWQSNCIATITLSATGKRTNHHQ